MRFPSLILSILITISLHAQEGAWSGELDIQGTKLPLVFHFDPEGCTMDSPSQGATGIKAEKSYTPEGKIKVSIPVIAATFEGIMVMRSITGTFTQGGMSFPLTLKPGVPKLNRPQTPVPPYPYTTEEVTFTSGATTMNGTLTLPPSYSKATPVVLLVTGSGQQNRDEELFEHKPFAVIADALARQGIASLRYDDRGYNDPSVIFSDLTTDDFKHDAAAGIDYLRSRFKTVGVVGHSEGGTIALMLASEGKTDFIVSLAGMAISGKETLIMQNAQSLKANGLTDAQIEQFTNILSTIFDQLAAGQSIEQFVGNTVLDPQERMIISQAAKQLSTPYIRHFITVDVRPSLSSIKCPVLALNGTLDTQVDHQANLDAIDKGITNAKHEVRALSNLNHLFQHCTTGQLTEYRQIEETISPEVLDLITTWITKLK